MLVTIITIALLLIALMWVAVKWGGSKVKEETYEEQLDIEEKRKDIRSEPDRDISDILGSMHDGDL